MTHHFNWLNKDSKLSTKLTTCSDCTDSYEVIGSNLERIVVHKEDVANLFELSEYLLYNSNVDKVVAIYEYADVPGEPVSKLIYNNLPKSRYSQKESIYIVFVFIMILIIIYAFIKHTKSNKAISEILNANNLDNLFEIGLY